MIHPRPAGRTSNERAIATERPRKRTLIGTTPLEVIAQLELARDEIATVVLTGAAGTDRDLATFLTEAYPCLPVVAGLADGTADGYLPTFC